MRPYELMVIIDPEVEERTVEPSLQKFLNVITNDGGTIEKVDIWAAVASLTTSRRSPKVSTPW